MQQCLEVWVAAQVVVECSPTVTLSVRVTSLGLRSAIPMGEGTSLGLGWAHRLDSWCLSLVLFCLSPLSAAPAARRALRHCEQIQAIENAPKPFKVKVHGKLPVCLEAGALTMVPVTCPQLESAEFLLEPLGFDGEQLPEGVQPGQSGIPGFAQEGEIPIDSPARNDPPAGNDDETRDAVIWYEAEHEPQEPQPAPTCPSVAEEIDMEDMAEMPEETTVAVRRSARPTAGQHSNPHRLPKTMSVMDDSPSGIEGEDSRT
ncbi:unnamed protein product [Arctogadus glacialis]